VLFTRRGIFVFFGSSEQQSQKTKKQKKKNEKKRGVFLGPLFAQKKPKQQHNKRVVFQFRAAVYHPHLII
jgi:hypothetical protein